MVQNLCQPSLKSNRGNKEVDAPFGQAFRGEFCIIFVHQENTDRRMPFLWSKIAHSTRYFVAKKPHRRDSRRAFVRYFDYRKPEISLPREDM
jgi:hypothetical protein